MVQLNLCITCPACCREMHLEANVDAATGELIDVVRQEQGPLTVSDLKRGQSRAVVKDVRGVDCADDCGVDWLSGQYTGKKERLRRELERLDRGCGLG